MARDRRPRPAQVLVGVSGAKQRSRLDVEPLRHVTGERIVRCRLVGDQVERLAAAGQFRNDVGGIAEQADRQGATFLRRCADARQRVVERFGRLVEVARRKTPLDSRRIDLDAEHRRAGERRRERLRSAHAPEACRQDRATGQRGRAVVLLARSRKRLVRALKDPLGADVDPRPGRHLAEHGQPLGLQPPELVPGRPVWNEERVRDQHPGRCDRRAKDSDRLAGLHEQRLVVVELQQLAHDRPQRLVRPCRLARSAVDHELLGLLRHLAVEIVEQHAKRRLGRPRARVQFGSARRPNRRQVAAERFDARVERRRDGHDCSSPRRAARSRRRSRKNAQPLATAKKTVATMSARTVPPPVASATRTTITARPA